MIPSFVLSHVPPCNVPQGYASVVPFPAALRMTMLSILQGNRHTESKTALLLPFIAQRSALHIEIAYFQRVGLNEVSSRFDLITHQNREDLVDTWHVF